MNKDYKYLPNDNPTDKWLKKVSDYYITTSLKDDVRNLEQITENHELMTGIMTKSYFSKTLNPLGLPQTDNDIPLEEEIIPIILPTINTLIGESYDRPLDFKAYVNNPDAISDKEKWLKSEFSKRLDTIVKQSNDLTEDEIKLKMMELQQWKEYDAQDIRERFANHLLNDFMTRYNFQQKTKNGWKEQIMNAQEIYLFDVIKGNMLFENINPKNIQIYGLPENGNVHESEAIVYSKYMTISEIVTKYGDDLKKKQLDEIIRGGSEGSVGSGIVMVFDNVFGKENETINNDNKLLFDKDTNEFITDKSRVGNKILVKTVYFKVLRKINILHYIDEVTGEEQIKQVSPQYEVNEDMGEWIEKSEYISEYWQSTKILENIYVDQKRCPVQMRDMNNMSLVQAPIVGKIYMVGDLQAKSIIDYLKPIQYQWTMFSKKVSILWSRNLGKLVRLDISKIPKKYGFDLDLFMSWITSFGIIVEDPWNEAMKGQPAGQFGSAMQAVDMELSSSISQALSYMMYLRSLADEVIGVSRQRKGDIMASDGLGTIQESINHSAKITEELFQEHHEIQKVLLAYMLEYGKYIIKETGDSKMQYITDSNIYELYKADPDIFKDVDYGISINNSRKQQQLEQIFLQLAHAYAQNGAIKMSEIMELYNTNSMSSRINKLKMKEKEQELQAQKIEQEKAKQQQMMQQMIEQAEASKHQREMQLQQLKNEGIVMVAQIQANAKIEAEQIQASVDLETTDVKSNTDLTKSIYQYKQNKDNKKQNKK